MPRASLLAAMILVACAGPEAPLEGIDGDYSRVMRDLAVADRDTARNVRNKEARSRKGEAERARVAFFRDPDVQAQIAAARAADAGTPLQMTGERWWREALTASSWTEEEKAQETRLLGRLEEARSVSATWTSPDGAAEVGLDEAWKEVSRVADGLPEDQRASLAAEYVSHRMLVAGAPLQELVKLRNDVARRGGFANYWEMALAAQGLTPGDVDQVVAELSAVVQPANVAMRQRIAAEAAARGVADTWANRPMLRRAGGLEAGRDEARHWFDADLAEERVMTAFQDMGLSTDGWQVHSGPRRYVRPGVYGFPIQPPEFVAIVMSNDERWSVWQYEALAHEGGHAAWWNNLDEEHAASPALWQPPAPWFEGFAQFFERQVFTEAFMERYVPEVPAEQRASLVAWRSRHLAEWITDSIVRTQVERRLYEDPANLEAVTRFAAETRSALTAAPAAPVAEGGLHFSEDLLSPIIWNYPAYSQNYLFAYLTEAALDQAITLQVGPAVGNPKVGPLLVEELVNAPVTQSFREGLVGLLRSEDLASTLRDDLVPVAPTPQAPDAAAE
jgi:hypothetical protein